MQVYTYAAMFAVVQTTLPGDNIAIEIDPNGDGQVDDWATHHLTVGAAECSPEQVRQLHHQSGKGVLVAVKVIEKGTGHYSVTYKLDSPGQYEMAVLVSKHPIADSPFTLRVE